MPRKGKEVAGKGKRKLDDDKSGGGRKRKNPNVLQFFEDAADEAYESSDSDLDDLFDDDFDMELKVESEPGKADSLPVFPKEEEMDEEDFDKMMEERYKDLSRFTYAGDGFETRRSVERNSFMPLVKDPTIWKVKCMVNRERHSAFCLMQKYVDLQSLGTKLQIISAFAVDHLKGHIYIEAHRQCDVVEACKGLCSIYATRVWAVPQSEVSHLLCVRHKYSGVSDGMWARVKNGKYKGDLAQVVAVNDERKRATVKLIPRIDLQALAQKFGSGVPIKRTATPAPRLISPSELEEFRPLIQYRRDRDTGLVFENLDSLMLKDGYVYKKVSIDSLNCSGVMPTEDELLKFKPAENEQSGDMEWLSQLYGEQKKKRIIKFEKGGGKGESSSGAVTGGGFELHDLVCFGRKDFGLVIGTEKDDSYKILKEGSEGPIVVTLPQNELKNGLFDAKFTALDKSMKSISINDSVRVLDGPCQGRLGIVKQIYRGTIFLYDETEAENGGYFCSKSQMCEKIKPSTDPFSDKGGESRPSGFDGFPSSPKSPLSPKNPWQARENKRDFNQGDKDGMFSIGQTLRIRLGPLKGYLCRVLAIRRSDITVKLDSQQKVLTVKSEHLCEVRGKSSSISMSEDPTSSTLKSCDLLGNQGSSSDWISAAGTSTEGGGWNSGGPSTEGGGWNSGGPSTERSSWPSFPASGIPVQPDSSSANPFGSASNDPKADVEGTAWDGKLTSSNQNVSWGTSAAKEEAVVNSSQAGDWSKSTDSWSKATSDGNTGSSSPAWGKANPSNSTNPFGSASNDPKADVEGTAWDSKLTSSNQNVSWGTSAAKEAVVNSSQAGDWCKSTNSWSKATSDGRTGSSAPAWGKANPSSDPKEADVSGGQAANWGNKKSSEETTDWSKGGSSNHDQTDSWNKPKDSGAGGSTWGKLDGGSWNKQDGDSSWERPKSFDGGRGYGGRGGGRGGRDTSGEQSTGWNREDGQEKNDNWKKSGAAGEDTGFGGWKGWGADKESGENQESGWGKKNTWNSGSSEVGGNQDSGWGKKSTWNSGSSEVGGNQDSGWGKKSTWNSGSSGGGNEDSGFGKKSTWNSGSSGGGNEDSGWGKKSTWNSGSSGNQDSDWGQKSSWNSGDASDGTEFAAGGNWRGGRGGRGGSDRGGFRGRGSYGDRGGSDGGGGFGGRGRSDRGGFGGRGRSDRGGFGGRGGDRGGFGGRGGDRGGFGGRGGDRGGFGGRGRGRDHGGGWNNRNDSGEDRPSSWSTGANNNSEGWKSNDGGSSWNQGSGTSKQGSGWGQGSNPTYEAAGGSSWKSSDASGGDQWSSWNKPSVTKEVKGAQDQEGGWSKGPAWGDHAKDAKDNSWGKAPASSWGGDNQGSAKPWNQPKAAGGPASGDQAKDAKDNSWGKAPASSWGQPSGWKESTDPKEGTNGSGEATDSWGKAASSSWGKGGDNGGSKGGW